MVANSTNTQTRFMKKPALIISLSLTIPVEYTMLLGGVATGRMNAYEHVTVAAKVKYNGWIFSSWDSWSNIGTTMLHVAEFDVTSVRNEIKIMQVSWITDGGRKYKDLNDSPIAAESPDALAPLERA